MYEIYERLINELGITTYRVAMDTGIAQSVFSAWKSGKSRPKPDKLKKIADRLHVSVDYLMGDTGEEEQKYYFDEESARIAQRICENPVLRVLFDADSTDYLQSDNTNTCSVFRITKKGSLFNSPT